MSKVKYKKYVLYDRLFDILIICYYYSDYYHTFQYDKGLYSNAPYYNANHLVYLGEL